MTDDERMAAWLDAADSDKEVLLRAAHRRSHAQELAGHLDLIARWSTVGEVVPVGAVAYDLVVAPDLDYEVFTAGPPTIGSGFRVLADLAEQPAVIAVRFVNALDSPDEGLYWQVRCRDRDHQEWKIDVWTLAHDHPCPLAAWIVEPMRRAPTDETRTAILRLKQARAADKLRELTSIHIYRAVIDDGVRTADDLRSWMGAHSTTGLTSWQPAAR